MFAYSTKPSDNSGSLWSIEGSTRADTSPLSTILRGLKLGQILANEKSSLTTLSKWFADTTESSRSAKLDNCLFVKSQNALIKSVTLGYLPNEGSSFDYGDPLEYLGGIGKDLEELLSLSDDNGISQAAEIMEREEIFQPIVKERKFVSKIIQNTQINFEANVEYKFYIHDRVVRSIKSRRLPLSYIHEIIIDKILEGAETRELHQYQKKVTDDIYELRLNKKERVLFTRFGRRSLEQLDRGKIYLIMDIIWDHKLDLPIFRAQRELDIMKNWMKAENFEEPFVIVDSFSGRLKPLYSISLSLSSDISSTSHIQEISSSQNRELDVNEDNLFTPNLMSIVLSPEQVLACAQVMERTERDDSDLNSNYLTSNVAESYNNYSVPESANASENFDEFGVLIVPERETYTNLFQVSNGPKPNLLNLFFFLGSAGNGKTTCLLRSCMGRILHGDKIVYVAVTPALGMSVKRDLMGCNVDLKDEDIEIISRQDFQQILAAEVISDELKVYNRRMNMNLDVIPWLQATFPKHFNSDPKEKEKLVAKLKQYAHYFMTHASIRDGSFFKSEPGSNVANLATISDAYQIWKRQENIYDDADFWNISLEKLRSRSDNTRRSPFLTVSCDILIVDEAQLFPAETVYTALLYYFHPSKRILLGMDSKQAIYIETSNRRQLLDATLGYSKTIKNTTVRESKYPFKTNFRLPAKLVSLSNAVVGLLRRHLRHMFDEFITDAGYEARSTVATSTSTTTKGVAIDEEAAAPSKVHLVMQSSSNLSGLSIESYPIIVLYGAAAHAFSAEIKRRMEEDRKSVLAVRLACTGESSSTTTSANDGNNPMINLPTINFQEVSGLEVSLPVFIDNLIRDYISGAGGVGGICPRSVFSKVNRGLLLTDAEQKQLAMGLCTIYTVITRCRGPLIWFEEGMHKELHPCLQWLKDHTESGSMKIEFISDSSWVNKEKIDAIFVACNSDIEESNNAWEETIRSMLGRVKQSLQDCCQLYRDMAIICVSDSLYQDFMRSDGVAKLMSEIQTLDNTLVFSDHPEVATVRKFLMHIPDLFKLCQGDWAVEWNQDLDILVDMMNDFPHLVREVAGGLAGAMVDGTTAQQEKNGKLVKSLKKICGIPASENMAISPLLAFKGHRNFYYEGGKDQVWTIYDIVSNYPFLNDSLLITMNDNGNVGSQHRWNLFSCDRQADLSVSVSVSGDQCPTILLEERSFKRQTGLSLCTSINCRGSLQLNKRKLEVSGAAYQFAFGPCIRRTCNDGDVKVERLRVAFGEIEGTFLTSGYLQMPAVGDAATILHFKTLIEEYCKFIDLRNKETVLSDRDAKFIWNNLCGGGKISIMGLPIEYRPLALLCQHPEESSHDSTPIIALDLFQRKLDSTVLANT